mgnify:FL=1
MSRILQIIVYTDNETPYNESAMSTLKVTIKKSSSFTQLATAPVHIVGVLIRAETATPRVLFGHAGTATPKEKKLLAAEMLRLHTISNGQPFNVYSENLGYAFEADWLRV